MARTTIRSEDITAGQIKSADLETNVVISGDLTVDTDTLYVDSTSGNVGIGTSSPSSWSTLAALDSNGTGFAGITAINSNANVGIGGIQFASDTTYTKAAIGLLRQYPNGGGALVFYNDSNADASNWTTSDEKMRIDISGNLLVGTTTTGTVGTYDGFHAHPQGHIASAATSTRSIFSRRSTNGSVIEFRKDSTNVGNISVTGSSTAYNTSSDYRLKENWQPMSGSIDRLKNLNPVNFAWKVDGSRVDGFLAHEAQEVVPEAVTGTKDEMRTEEYEVTPAVFNDEGVEITAAVMGTREVPEYQGIDQSKLVPLLTSALQEAVAKIESLEARVAALESN